MKAAKRNSPRKRSTVRPVDPVDTAFYYTRQLTTAGFETLRYIKDARQPVISPIPAGKAPYLIVLVHGCCTSKDDFDRVWGDFANKIHENIMQTKAPGQWEIVKYDWTDDTHKPAFPHDIWPDVTNAYNAAAEHRGFALAAQIITHHYTHVHLIGHSAGAKLIDVAANELVKKYKTLPNTSRPFKHMTFLDAYTRSPGDVDTYGYLDNYRQHYSEHYVDRTRGLACSAVFSSTNNSLKHAFNVDVTDWEPNNPVKQADPILCGHLWPIRWYKNSIVYPGYLLGYPHSLEGSNDRFYGLGVGYAAGNECVIVKAENRCAQRKGWRAPAWADRP